MRSTSSSKGKQNENVVHRDTMHGESARVMPLMVYRPVDFATHDTVSHVQLQESGLETSTITTPTTKQGKIRSASRTRTELSSTAGRLISSERDPRFSPAGGSALEQKPTENSSYNNTAAKLTNRSRTRSPEERRHSTGQLLNCVPEDTEMSVEPRGRLSFSSQRYYGSIDIGTGYPASLEMEEVGDLNEDEEELILDEELAKNGLYRGMNTVLSCLFCAKS